MTAPSPLPTDEDAREAWRIVDEVRRGWTRIGSGETQEIVDALRAAGFRRSVVSTPEPAFSVGDRVYCLDPVNESWNPDYTATVLAVHGDRIDIRWDHGGHNSGQLASDFGLRSAVSAPPTTDAGDVISIPRPVVPFGPAGISEDKATAQYLREVIHKIEGGYAKVGGSNVTRTVMSLLASTATVLENRALGGEEKTQ